MMTMNAFEDELVRKINNSEEGEDINLISGEKKSIVLALKNNKYIQELEFFDLKLIQKVENLKEKESIVFSYFDKICIILALQHQNAWERIIVTSLEDLNTLGVKVLARNGSEIRPIKDWKNKAPMSCSICKYESPSFDGTYQNYVRKQLGDITFCDECAKECL